MLLAIIKEPLPALRGYRVYISRITPLNFPDVLGGDRKSGSLPFLRGGLGWGKMFLTII